MYEKLLISAGGGVISREQQADQDNCATIAIGLGGTGIDCLKSLKKEIFTRVKPDDTTTIAAQYRHIKFLAVDTDPKSIGDNGHIDSLDSNTEFFNISDPDISGALKKTHILKEEPHLQWLKMSDGQNNGISILSAEAGAGGVRQVGRYLLMRSSKKFREKIEQLIKDARLDLPANSGINIHIFTGLSGGTGAGTFLDVCYILQKVLENIGLGSQAYTCGYFFLPDVNIDKTPNVDYIACNGFASMKELDYCMNFRHNGGRWTQQYDGFKVDTDQPPVKLAHLITATNSDGAIVSDAYNYAMHVAVDYVLEYIIKPYIGADFSNDNGEFTIKSHISNVEQLIGEVDKKHGACYNYCILGAANTYLPFKEITTYLTSKIFEGFEKISQRVPSDLQVENFLKENGLSYDDISRALRAKVPPVPNYPVDHKELYTQVAGLTRDTFPPLMGVMWNKTSEISGKLEENKSALLDSEGAVVDGKVTSLIARVDRLLREIAADPDRGPYYADAMLHNLNDNDIRNKLQGYIERNKEVKKKLYSNIDLYDNRIAATLQELQCSNIFNRKARAEAYYNAVRQFIVCKTDINRCDVLDETLSEFYRQIDALHSHFFGTFAEVIRELQDTFAKNLEDLAKPVLEDKSYAIKLMTIPELKPSLDAAVKKMDVDGQIRGFVQAMFDNYEDWKNKDENAICKVVSEYFLDQLKEFTGKTIVHYLKAKFDVDEPAELQRKIFNEIILPLGEKASPLFWTDNGYYQLSDSRSMGYLSIPNISSEIKSAAEEFTKANPEINIRPIVSTERITIFRFVCGVPMFGYRGVEIYKNTYRTKQYVGAHLYEGATGDPRDTRKCIDISPISCVSPKEFTETDKANLEMYNLAVEYGIVEKASIDTDRYDAKLNRYNLQELSSFIGKAETVLKNGNSEEITALKKEIIQKKFSSESIKIGVNQFNDRTENILRDHILGSILYVDILREQVEAFKKYRKVTEDITNMEDTRKLITDFSRALCRGAIQREDEYTYSYSVESFGITDRKELTSLSVEPYGMELPLYSAYVNYCELDKKERETIDDMVKNNSSNKEVLANSTALVKEIISGKKLTAMVNNAKIMYPDQAESIIVALKQMAEIFNNFVASRE